MRSNNSNFIAVSIVLVLQVLVITSLQLKSPDSSHSTLSHPLHLQVPSLKRSKNKFAIRKCCGPGQVYNYEKERNNISYVERCVSFSISSSHPLPEATPFLLGWKQDLPPPFGIEDVQIIQGFPHNCTPDDYEFGPLEPEKKMEDLFYVLSTGRLLVPHQFIFLEFDSYCIEDQTTKQNVTKAIRRAFICEPEIQPFPKSAIDESGKLRLDFIEAEADAKMLESKFTGRRVIRKCCAHNQSLDRHGYNSGKGQYYCRKNKDFATRFFENLQQRERPNELFFRFGSVKCDFPTTYTTYTKEFQLNSNGSLEIEMDNTISHRLLPIEQYCLEDMVEFDAATGLPFSYTYAMYCSDAPNNSTLDVTTEPFPTEQPLNESDYKTNSDNSTQIQIPKCCSPGHVMDEDWECHPLWMWPIKEVRDKLTEPAEIVPQSLNSDFKTHHNISNILFVPNNTTLSSCQLKGRTPVDYTNLQVTPIFRKDPKSELSLTLHQLVKNYWDVKSKIQPFCVDQLLFRKEKAVYFGSQIFYCITQEPSSSYRPVILLISVVGLVATFIIYFLVPASGAVKLVMQRRGSKQGGANAKRNKTIAMVLTGRILLCHIFSLSLAFTCLAIIQLKLVESQENSCVVIGYIMYWAFIASFSWLTVYCFDYYRIFSGSFKVSNDNLFVPYSAFGWGFSILALAATIVAQFRSTSMGISDTVNPNIGFNRCEFPGGNSSAKLIFFYGPVGVLLLFDIFFFLSMMFSSNLMHCWQSKQETKIRKNSTVSNEREDLKMATKLFFITGIPWIFEFVAYFYELAYGFNTYFYYFFEFTGQLLNMSRGVFIFLNFVVLNRNVRQFLWPRIKIFFSRHFFTTEEITATYLKSNTEESHSNEPTQPISSPSGTCSETISTSIDRAITQLDVEITQL